MPKQSLPSSSTPLFPTKQTLLDAWGLKQQGSYYRNNWGSSNKNEKIALEAYWANGGTVPQLKTLFGQSEVKNAQAYWSL